MNNRPIHKIVQNDFERRLSRPGNWDWQLHYDEPASPVLAEGIGETLDAARLSCFLTGLITVKSGNPSHSTNGYYIHPTNGRGLVICFQDRGYYERFKP